MNHRELILCSIRKPRFSFMALPHELQDQLIEEMESNRLSFIDASKRLHEMGYELSYNAIAAYCSAVRSQRRAFARHPQLFKEPKWKENGGTIEGAKPDNRDGKPNRRQKRRKV